MTPGIETVTILFTDDVDSTTLFGRIGPEAADRVRRERLAALRGAVAERGGREIKNVGDGIMAAFRSAAAAIACSVDMQRRVSALSVPEAEGASIFLRIGIAAGDAEVDEYEYFGPSVVEASRLCAAASGGQILVTELVRMLAGGRGAHELVPVGEIDLKGFDRPVAALEVRWRAGPGGGGDPLAVPLPAVLALESEFPFVGRSAEWEGLEAVWFGAGQGRRQAVLIGGEAGTGKTRLVREFAGLVHQRGGVVLYGSCSADVEHPYQPFAEALDHAVASVLPDERERLVGTAGRELGRLLPRLRGLGPVVDEPAGDGDASRFRLFEAVTDLLVNLTARSPLLLVVDDVHWARWPTVQLLHHLLRSTRLARLCVIALYRNAPAEMGEPLREALPDLRRYPGTHRLRLVGLDRVGVRAFVAATAGHDADTARRPWSLEPLVEHLVSRTDGNPFLMGEQWRHLVEVGALRRHAGRWFVAGPLSGVDSPETVREMVVHRMGALPSSTGAVLELAAVTGAEFDLAAVAGATGLSEDQVLDALLPAIEARLVDETGPARFRFAHALVRQSVEDGLSPGVRRRLHLAVGRAIERRTRSDPGELAHHFAAAVPLVPAETAIGYARRAAAAAMRAVAYDNAVSVLAVVFPLARDAALRADLLLDQAEASMRAGDTAASMHACDDAAALARSLDDVDRLVRAALLLQEATWRGAVHGGPAVKLTREALAQRTDEPTRARLLAGLATALAFSGQTSEALDVADQAICLARAVGDHFVLIRALMSPLFAIWTPATVERQVACADELVQLAGAAGDDEALLQAYDKLLIATLMVGDVGRFREVLDRHGRLARRLRQPLYQVLDAQMRSVLALQDGRFADAERFAEEVREWARELPRSAGGYGVQMFNIRREQGRLEQVRPAVEAVAKLGRGSSTWLPGLGALYAELGLAAEAERLLTELTADDLGTVARDSLWPVSLSLLADTCAATGNVEAAEAVYRHLLPYQGFAVVVGGLAAYGAADRYLGRLADVRGRPADAARHLEAALNFDEGTGSPTWTAHSAYALGGFLSRRGRRGDHDRATTLLRRASEIAEAVGMAALLSRCQVERESVGRDTIGSAATLTERERSVLALLAEGRTNREIGEALHMSQHTAANHVRAILLKTATTNRTEAARWAQRQGLLT